MRRNDVHNLWYKLKYNEENVKVIKSRFRAQHSVIIAGSAKDAEEFEIVHDFPAKFRCSRKTRSHLIKVSRKLTRTLNISADRVEFTMPRRLLSRRSPIRCDASLNNPEFRWDILENRSRNYFWEKTVGHSFLHEKKDKKRLVAVTKICMW